MRKNKNSQPQPTIENEGDDVLTATGESLETVDNVTDLRPTTRTNVFSAISLDETHKAAAKMQHLGQARQLLAEAKDFADRGDEYATEAKETAASAIALLYQARVNGEMGADEVTAALGDTFGYKLKKDGKPGRTPAGLGEPIRKRIVRLTQAAAFATGDNEAAPFFTGLDADDVAQVLNEVENGNATGWQAYDRFAEMKREAGNARVPLAFDSAKIVALASALTEKGAIEELASNPGLWTAYGRLVTVLSVIGEDDKLVAAYEAQRDAA